MDATNNRVLTITLDKYDVEYLAETGKSKSLKLDDERETTIQITLSAEAREEYTPEHIKQLRENGFDV